MSSFVPRPTYTAVMAWRLIQAWSRFSAKFCQTPLQLANPTQLQLVGERVDFDFPRKKKKEERKEEVTPT